MAQGTRHQHMPARDYAMRRAQMELAAARERGEPDALEHVLAAYPKQAGALIDFSAALIATSGYADVVPDAGAREIAGQARNRAFAAVFGAQAAPAAQPVADAQSVVSLKALRQARKLSLKAVADRLGIGVDVLSALEAGRIRAQSVPERFTRALSGLLDAAAETVSSALAAPGVAPAFQRAKGTRPDEQPQLDFTDVVRRSPEMTAEQKAAWLEE